MKKIQEGHFRLELPENWEIVKYDDSNFFRKKVTAQHTKAVDFVVKSPDGEIFLLELKDLRRERQHLGRQMANENWVDSISQKVKDTLAGLFGSYRWENNDLFQVSSAIFPKNDVPIKFIFFLEEDVTQTTDTRFRLRRRVLKSSLDEKLSYLRISCNILNHRELQRRLPWRIQSC